MKGLRVVLAGALVASCVPVLGGCGKAAEVISDKEYIEYTLNLANNTEYTWSYSNGAWTMSIVSAVAYPEIEDEEGVSVCVPAAYVEGVDTTGDGAADVTADTYSEAVNGQLVIDYAAEVTSTNGQVYTAATAPVILNTGAAGYGSASNTKASSTYAAEGYINVACGNRGKQDTATDEDGNEYYTGDAPSCLADQKAAARFVKFNILLGNLPGCVDYLVSTGGSGGGAHAAMFAATSNNSDFYAYQEAVGAVGCYACDDGSWSTTVTVDGAEVALSDGAWGCIAYSAITSIAEADMAQAFEYFLCTSYNFGSSFQAQLAEYLSEAYMDYINEQNLSVEEAAVGFDLDGDGALASTVALTIEYDEEAYADTNGYGGTYLDLYLAEFVSNLQWYVDNLDYTSGWTWFDENGAALSDDEVAAMSSADKALAFVEGRYASGSSSSSANDGPGEIDADMAVDGDLPSGDLPSGDLPSGEMPSGGPDGDAAGGDLPSGEMPSGEAPADMGGNSGPDGTEQQARGGFDTSSLPDGEAPSGDFGDGQAPGDIGDGEAPSGEAPSGDLPGNTEGTEGSGDSMDVGTPEAGTTQAAGSSTDSSNYETYADLLAAYQADIAELQAGDKYGNNLVDLYNPLNYIGAEGTEGAAWTRIVMGAAEGDICMFSSLNLQIAWLNAGTDCEIEWQWDGGHVPSEVLGESFALYIDQMYAEYAGGATVEKAAAEAQATNGSASSATGTDLSSWVACEDGTVSFSLASAMAYRAKGSSKSVPGFDVIDYGQEDYVFGSATQDARHWDVHLLQILEDHEDELSALFNAG